MNGLERRSRLTFSIAALVIAWAPITPALSAATSTPDAATTLANSLRALQDGENAAPRDHRDPKYVEAQHGNDPARTFAWVRDQTDWVPYHGILRGPVGVLKDGQALMTTNRAELMIAAVLLTTPTQARAQAANGSCKPVFDAMLKETSTPHHMVTMRGGTQEGESISTADAIYAKVKGVWQRSPMTPKQMLAQQQENIRNVTVASCTSLPDDAVDGQPAALYHAHYEQQDLGSSDARIWIAKATGLPIRSDVSLQGDQKTSITTRYDYANITAPVVK